MATTTLSGDIKRLVRERDRFRANAFLNPEMAAGALAPTSKAAAAAPQGNTFFEEIGCVGYQPQTERLETVIYVNQPVGYGGKLCGNGSREFVRYYASWDEGVSWTDLGMSTLQVWDIPEGTDGRKRLEYAVTHHVDFRRRICLRPQVVRVRAILSWSVPPPAGQPNWSPFWGEVHNTNILIEPARLIRFPDLLDAVKVQLNPELLASLDLSAELPMAPKPLDLPQLAKLYEGSDVPPKRFAFAQLSQMLSGSAGGAMLGPIGGVSALSSLKLDPSIFDELLNPGDGNTSFEQLECIGYDPVDDSMVGVIRVKKPTGFSGGPCSDGSREYVTFWADIDNNGSFETCLGTASVRVYDIARFPQGGLEFAVHLPVNLKRFRQPCNKGPRIIPIRAILSWQTPVTCPNPNQTPVWGNREETLVHVAPGREIGTGLAPELAHVGAVQVDEIQSNGLTQNTFALTGLHVSQSPFGGRIDLAGKILNGDPSTRYRFMIRKQGIGAFVPLGLEPTGITLKVVTPGPTFTNVTLHADADGYYAYQDYSMNHYVVNQILAAWHTGTAEHGSTFELRLDVKDPGNPAVDIEGAVVAVRIDNKGPDMALSFTTLAGDCAHFDDGAVFAGLYSVTDQHFGSYSFRIYPPGPANGVLPVPPGGSSVHFGGTVSDPGLTNAPFTLNTAGMDSCGYALVLHVVDRANVNSGADYHHNEDSIGFCLGSPPKG
jgi:hypothetical protein